MPLITSKIRVAGVMEFDTRHPMLEDARREGYAVGAFNVENMEMVKAVIQAAEELKSPVILQTTPSTVKYGTAAAFAAIVKAEADINTDPSEAKIFVEQTNIDSLAVAIGTAHGFYEGEPALDKRRISEIKKVVSVPLVLHGSSGLKDEEIRECVSRGMCKVNFATELRVAFTDAVKQLLKENGKIYDPKVLGNAAIYKVKELVKKRMTVCGSQRKIL